MLRNYQYWDTGDVLYNKLAGTEYVWKGFTTPEAKADDIQFWIATQIAKVNTNQYYRTPSRLSGISGRGW